MILGSQNMVLIFKNLAFLGLVGQYLFYLLVSKISRFCQWGDRWLSILPLVLIHAVRAKIKKHMEGERKRRCVLAQWSRTLPFWLKLTHTLSTRKAWCSNSSSLLRRQLEPHLLKAPGSITAFPSFLLSLSSLSKQPSPLLTSLSLKAVFGKEYFLLLMVQASFKCRWSNDPVSLFLPQSPPLQHGDAAASPPQRCEQEVTCSQ